MLWIYRSKVLIMYNQKSTMTIRYEINPPKISDDGQDARNVLFGRIKLLVLYVMEYILLTLYWESQECLLLKLQNKYENLIKISNLPVV